MSVDNKALSSDESKDPLTYEESEILLMITYVFSCTGLCLFGITANIINIVVFTKQSYNNTINISLCALSVCDLCCLVVQLWVNICFNPLLKSADIPFVSEEIQYLTGVAPYGVFVRINGWITVFITTERCLSIAVPLKVKQLITPKRTVIILIVLYVVNILCSTSEYRTYHLAWKFYPARNRTLYGIVLEIPDYFTSILTYVVHTIIGFGSFLGVVVCNVVLVVNLNRKSEWRKTVTVDSNQHDSAKTTRDQKTVKMVTIIASIFIFTYIPLTVLAFVMTFEPNLCVLGKYQNSFFAFLSICSFFQNINSSINIFLYYHMSTKYRETFHAVFIGCKKA